MTDGKVAKAPKTDGTAEDRKHIRIERSYHNKVEEGGWVRQGRVFNVGREHTKGLMTVTPTRAAALVQRGLAKWHEHTGKEGVPHPEDPVAMKEKAAAQLARRAGIREAPPKRVAVDPARRTKVETPERKNPTPTRGPGGQDPAPTPPEKFAAPRRPAPNASLTKPKSESGGRTGAAPDSSSSSPADPPPSPSTGQQRGTRRGDSTQTKAASAGVQSTRATGSSRKLTASTARTSHGGDTDKDSKSSED